MDRVNRLCLLFNQDEALLQVNTGLRVTPPEPIVENAPQEENHDTAPSNLEDLEKVLPDQTTLQHPGQPKPDQESESTASSEQTPQDPLEHDGSFCPLLAISRYPYRFLKDKLSQSVASRFFDRGKFWSRSWDV